MLASQSRAAAYGEQYMQLAILDDYMNVALGAAGLTLTYRGR